jgi:hypothetical protein
MRYRRPWDPNTETLMQHAFLLALLKWAARVNRKPISCQAYEEHQTNRLSQNFAFYPAKRPTGQKGIFSGVTGRFPVATGQGLFGDR